MQEIMAPVSLELLKSELTPDRKVQDTHKGNNEIYIVTWHDSPNVLREIGRLRELAFREGGGGSGLDCDLDEYDTMEKPYKQLIVWDPDAQAIIGGYRYILGNDIILDEKGQPILATSHMFNFTKKFIDEYLPYTIELGRSFVSPIYQTAEGGRKSLFALDNLWDGLTSLMMQSPKMKYFFGKMTMYPTFNRYGRDVILHFLHKHFADEEKLVTPYNPIKLESDMEEIAKIFTEEEFKEDYKILNATIRNLGENIPPLVNSYMKVSPTMKVFGTAINDIFGDVEETSILVNFDDMYEEKRSRYVNFYIKHRITIMKERFPIFVEEAGDLLPDLLNKRRERRQKTKIEKVLSKQAKINLK